MRSLALTSPIGSGGLQAAATGDCAALLWRVAGLLAAAAALTSLAAWIDDRQLGPYNVWTKPLKFQLALAGQTATLAWAVPRLAPALRGVALPGWLARAWCAVVLYEAGYITLQGARGVASHFKRGSAWESLAGTLMASGAGVLVSVTMWIGVVALWQAWRERQGDGQALLGVPSLLPLSIGLGFVLGGLPAAWSGSAMGAARGYWPEPLVEPVQWMPVTGWVLSQTDLRIAHFVGLHQMQLLPALAVLAGIAGWRRRSTAGALAIAAVGGVVATLLLMRA